MLPPADMPMDDARVSRSSQAATRGAKSMSPVRNCKIGLPMQPRNKAIGRAAKALSIRSRPYITPMPPPEFGLAAAVRHKVGSPIRHNLPGTCCDQAGRSLDGFSAWRIIAATPLAPRRAWCQSIRTINQDEATNWGDDDDSPRPQAAAVRGKAKRWRRACLVQRP
jgi:hypothetical protein